MVKPKTFAEKLSQMLIGRRFADAIIDRFQASMVGEDHVPKEGAALLVGNHTIFGIDSVVLGALVQRRIGRTMRWLGEKNIWRIPGLRDLVDAAGGIPGEPEGATELLEEGELVGVYPGGVDDSFKLAREAYVLKWGTRAGFARVAMRAKAPIVPVAATGIDELFTVVGRESTLGRLVLGSERYDLPIVMSLLPKKIPLVYHALDPIDTSGDPDDPDAVERVRLATWEAMESVLRPYREKL